MIIQQRVFLVGCARSGTTLLQSMLAVNSSISSFPESHFYVNLFGGRPWRWFLGIASRKARPRLKEFLMEIGHMEMQSRLPSLAITNRQFSNSFVEILDQLTLNQGKKVWLEKTPAHLHFIDQIEKLVAGAKFVHILRDGKDNIASLYDIGVNYADKWYPERQSLDKCIGRWIKDARLSLLYSTRANHHLVRYEHLIEDPRAVLTGVCNFIDVPFEEQMMSDYPIAASNIILDKEPWKNNTYNPINDTRNTKFQKMFNESQKRYIILLLSKEFSEDSNYRSLF